MQVTPSVAIMQVLRFYCSYAGGTFCYSYVGGSFCCKHNCFCCNYAVISVSSSYADDSLCREYVGDNFYCDYASVSLLEIMQVVFSAMHGGRDCFYCNYAGDSPCCISYVGDSFKSQFYISFSDTHFS